MASIQDPPSQSQSPGISPFHQQHPRLALQVDQPPSSSPFPSPSSSFLPPPMPGAHEFAVRPPPLGKGKKAGKADPVPAAATTAADEKPREKESGLTADRADLGDSKTVSPVTPTPANKSSFVVPLNPSGDINSARTPTSASLPLPAADLSPVSPATTPTGIPTPSPTTPTDSPRPTRDSLIRANPTPTPDPTSNADTTPSTPNQHRNSMRISTHRDSLSYIRRDSTSSPLTSSRPAPPSPAISRRASGAASTTSARSRSSRPPSQVLSRNPSTRKSTQLSQSQLAGITLGALMSSPTPQSGSPSSPPQQQKKRRSLLVKIKDFAFASTDDRHAGLGADVPRPNRVRVLNRFHRSRSASNASHLSVSSTSSTQDDGEDEEEEGSAGLGEDGWGGFKWGFGRFSSWGFGRGAAAVGIGGGGGAGDGSSASANFPSKTDFARNFAGGEADAYRDDEDDDDDYYDDDDEDSFASSPSDEEPLYPGLYRALYAFEPEGTAEMKLEEEQVVRVIGRGGGVGWAVVERRWGADGVGAAAEEEEKLPAHALVPESYLEVVRLDEEEEGDDDGGGSA